MDFEKPQDYVDALKRLEGFPLMGMKVMDGRLIFTSLSSHVAIPLRNKGSDWGYRVGRYGLNNLDGEGHTVLTVELAHPTDPLPAYVAALKEALIGSSVQSVSATDGGLCLHLDDDYDAVTNGVLRVRVDSERVPFTVGDVFVNRGGTDLTLCICTQTESKPVVAFKIDRDTLDGKEMAINVI